MSNETSELTINISAMSNGPDAIGHTTQGHTVFVPYALPGETVRVQVTKDKKRLKWAKLVEVIAAQDTRIEPRCVHYGTCGGCHLQHASYTAQLQLKRDIVADQLQRIGGLQSPPVADTLPAPDAWHYRNHLQLAQNPAGQLGRRALRSEQVIPLQECPIIAPPLLDLYRQLDFEPLPNVEHIDLWLGTENDIMLVLATRAGSPPALEIDLPISVVSLDHTNNIVVLAGDDHLIQTVHARPFRISAGSRFPANAAQIGTLVDQVVTALDLQSDEIVFDLFCATGLFSAFIAPHVSRVLAFEDNERAVEDAVVNLDEFDNIALYVGPIAETLPRVDAQPDKLLLAPPHTGAGKAVIQAVLDRLAAADAAPPRIVYASSEPVTLARDTAQLVAGGYRLTHVQPIDLYPQDHHIDTVATFVYR